MEMKEGRTDGCLQRRAERRTIRRFDGCIQRGRLDGLTDKGRGGEMEGLR